MTKTFDDLVIKVAYYEEKLEIARKELNDFVNSVEEKDND
tara:strand:+ start:460 stop:579 length:120 start_codon:yes stop_codon:yes gene_type:complete